MSNELLTDAAGKRSSKRVCGILLLVIGTVFLMLTGILALIGNIGDPQTALTAGQSIIYLGGALLGLGVFERIGKE